MTQLVAPEFCEHHRPTHAAQVMKIDGEPNPSWKAVVVYKCKFCCTHVTVTDSQQIRVTAGGKPLPVYRR